MGSNSHHVVVPREKQSQAASAQVKFSQSFLNPFIWSS